ncbi:uncharacterized protein LOC121385560 isoform X2 [Gigantopelta aegis]|uniref:uncharacterized protein LOC121385560 isoform X2 n=1 Tax=Gigantopelta aegis TaxID=1735272 RepID=UPI001B8879FE|nr:uncharacterized protein LOC121385560 isoform X2 [Gigantopelta aegis]
MSISTNVYSDAESAFCDGGLFNKDWFPERRQFEGMELQESAPSDLTELGDLSNDRILEVVKKRYEKNEIYTSGGGHDILLSVNPFKDLPIYTNEYHKKYGWKTLTSKDEPHIFAITTKAYKRLRETEKNQVVLVTGESGSGKTENTKLMVKHLISMCGSNSPDLAREIIEVNPLLEAFGNAKTVLNDNSSRFAKYLEIGFDDKFQITDATIRDYMLEKSRVVSHSEGEANFHVFYSFLAGLDENEKKDFKLDSANFRIAPKPYPKRKEELVRDFKQQLHVMQMIGLSEEEIGNVKAILASILHITNITFNTAKNNAVEVKDEFPMIYAATMLEIDLQQFAKFLVIRKITVSGEVIDCLNSKEKADEVRDAVAKMLYERLFGWLVRQINVALHKPNSRANTAGSIGILDICGFESLPNNGLEQLCINIVNEKFQMFMNDQMFRREKEIYESEGLEWEAPEYTNNQEIVDMFFKRTGILSLIDEDTKFQQATDETLVRKLDDRFSGSVHYHKTKGAHPEFFIHHFAGSVKYNAAGFLEKNGNELSPEMLRCLKSSNNEMVSDLFTVRPTNTGTISGTPFTYRMSTRHQPVCHKPRGNNKITAGLIRDTLKILKQRYGDVTPQSGPPVMEVQNQKTVVTYFQNSMQELLTRMETAEARFVRCVKPNENQTPDEFDDDKVLEQLTYNGISEVAQIRRLGYPVRFRYQDFFERYYLLYPECRNIPKKSEAAEAILTTVDADQSLYKLGREQVFLKEEINDKLSLRLVTAKEVEEERLKEERRIEEERLKEERRIEEERLKEERRIQEERKRKEEEERKTKAGILKKELKPFLDPIVEVQTPASSIIVNNINPNSLLYSNPDSASASTLGSSSASASGQSSQKTTETKPDIDSGGHGNSPPLPSRNDSAKSKEEEVETKQKTAFWDIFRIVDRELPVKDVHEQMPMKVLKLVFYLFFFLVLLVACVGQKVSLMVLLPSLDDKNQDSARYLLTVVVVVVPYALTSFMAFFKWLFGGVGMPSLSTFCLAFVMETLHSFGMCLLIFRILPFADQFTGIALISSVAALPCLLRLISCHDVRQESDPHLTARGNKTCCLNMRTCCNSKCGRVTKTLLDIVVLLAQLSVIPSIVMWDLLKKGSESKETIPILTVTAAFVFVSFGNWENFTDDRFFCKIKPRGVGSFILKARYELQEGRSGLFMLTHLWKIILTTILAYFFQDNLSFDLPSTMKSLTDSGNDLLTIGPVFGLVFSSLVAYYIGYIACKLRMQNFSFSVPLVLSTPVAYCVFVLNSQYNMLRYIMTDSSSKYPGLMENWHHLVGGIVWWLSLLWLTRHIWFPRQENLAKFERMFTNPMYCGILTTENLLLNRRRDTRKVIKRQHEDTHFNIIETYELHWKENRVADGEAVDFAEPEASDLDIQDVPRIYACATMWHENRVEMVQLLKSLHRLDADQWNRKQAMMISGEDDPNFYEYEAHIFFDDAMEIDNDDKCVANSYVKMLVSLVAEACSCVHNRPMAVHNPYKVVTPYGAQLVWQMPGENLLYVHIKDKNRIRHRKRWSQVMYMYYLLGYRLTKESEDELIIAIENNLLNTKSRLAIFEHLSDDVVRKSENTFILALDGDTDFMPGAVRLLVDRMRKGQRVGAACGRIHPIGSGPLVWYQKFEYAIGHWLQKSTEHVLGCVLCSPGCFSLFRGSALMDDNIIRKYTILPTEPGHFLQYEQGEDRWLCTLLLQQGYRVDYVAGADAFTYAPEGFNEFFNQRRRWMPSTLANIMDLLTSANLTVSVNPNISMLYIWYQMAIMFGTVLGPGTVTLMIAGSIQKVFELDLIVCYVIAIVPPAVYIVACYHLKPKYQLIFAAILSTAYAFLMMVVLVGTFVTAAESPFHPSVIFFVGLIAIFLFTGLLHIKELGCLAHGLLYMITLPAGYLVLVIYSMCNLFNVSWGTREAPKRKTQAELEQEKIEKEKPKDGFLAKLFLRSSYLKELKDLLQSLGNISLRKEDKSESQIVEGLKELNKNFIRYATRGNEPLAESGPEEIVVDSVEPKQEEKMSPPLPVVEPPPPPPKNQLNCHHKQHQRTSGCMIQILEMVHC